MQAALTVENLCYSSANKSILSDISFEVSKPQKIALVGLNGAGKSTLIQLLVAELACRQGQIRFAGAAPGDLQVKNKLGYQAATMGAIPYLTAHEYLDFCCLLKYELRANRQQWIDRVTESWGLGCSIHQPTKELSLGNLQKLNIAQAFLGEPDYVFLDEPSQALDPIEQQRFAQNLSQLPDSQLCLFSSHNVNEMVTIADQVLLLDKGRLIAQLYLQDLTSYWFTTSTMIEEVSEHNIELVFKGRQACLYQARTTSAEQELVSFVETKGNFLGNSGQALMPLFNLLASEAL